MSHSTYQILANNSNTSWICCQCGMPSFSSSLFNTTPVDLSNSFSSFNSNSSSPLTITSPLHPLHSSTPNPPNRTRQTIRSTAINRPISIVNINFQSCRNKLQELQHIAHSVKPDVIIGTETWLQPSITSNEIFKPEMGYTLYRKDRLNQAYMGGGVLIAVCSEIVSSACPYLDTDCELLWVQIDLTGAKSLYIGAFYRPPDSDVTTLENLDHSLQRLTHRTNVNIWLGGDFNAPHINWPLLEVTPLAGTKRQIYQRLIDISLHHNIEQVRQTNQERQYIRPIPHQQQVSTPKFRNSPTYRKSRPRHSIHRDQCATQSTKYSSPQHIHFSER